MRGSALPVGRPRPHNLPEDRELADVLRVVVAHQADLAQDGVPGVPGMTAVRSVDSSATSAARADRSARNVAIVADQSSVVATAAGEGQYSSGQWGETYARSRM